jgi:hypothetical protein
VVFHVAVNPVVETDVAVVATGEGETVATVMVFDITDSTPAELVALKRYLYVVPELAELIETEVDEPERLSKPARTVLKLSLETSRFKLAAPETALQFALKPVVVIEVAAVALGVEGLVFTEIEFEFADVPDVFTARIR